MGIKASAQQRPASLGPKKWTETRVATQDTDGLEVRVIVRHKGFAALQVAVSAHRLLSLQKLSEADCWRRAT